MRQEDLRDLVDLEWKGGSLLQILRAVVGRGEPSLLDGKGSRDVDMWVRVFDTFAAKLVLAATTNP